MSEAPANETEKAQGPGSESDGLITEIQDQDQGENNSVQKQMSTNSESVTSTHFDNFKSLDDSEQIEETDRERLLAKAKTLPDGTCTPELSKLVRGYLEKILEVDPSKRATISIVRTDVLMKRNRFVEL